MTITEAVKMFGNQSRLCEALGIAPSVVSMWKARGGNIPICTQWQLELGTGGKLVADKRPLLSEEERKVFRDLLRNR